MLSGVDECAGECAGVGVGVASGTAPSQHVVSLLLDSANPAMSQMDDLESEASALGGTAGLMDEAGPLALPPLPPLHPHRHPHPRHSPPPPSSTCPPGAYTPPAALRRPVAA